MRCFCTCRALRDCRLLYYEISYSRRSKDLLRIEKGLFKRSWDLFEVDSKRASYFTKEKVRLLLQ